MTKALDLLSKVYLQCFYLALNNKQTVGKDKYYYITLEQLEDLINTVFESEKK